MRPAPATFIASVAAGLLVVVSSPPTAQSEVWSSRTEGGAVVVVDAHGAQAEGAASSESCPRRVLARMSLSVRVGQLFVAGVSSASPTRAQLRAIRRLHLGGVILTGHSGIGATATRTVVRRLQAQATRSTTHNVKLWVAVDQEGGYVQVLDGPGFSTMPTALAQGTLSRAALHSRAHRWGGQLARAGVNLDLAPVMDTVPARLGTANIPIGYYHREYGHRPAVVAGHGTAVIDGLQSSGVQTTAKHFPGLGRVRRNTDTSAHVTDKQTTRHDPYLQPFQAAVDSRVPVVMVSLAHYPLIDRRIAAFSPIVLRAMLRHDLAFSGVIMSDSMTAVSVHSVPVGARAVRFLLAGGTVALSVTTSTTRTMESAVLLRAQENPRFRALVGRDALTVLRVKHRNGLLPC